MDVTIDDIRKAVALQLGRRRVAADERIVEDLGAESLDVVNLIARLEERYRINLDEAELPTLRTVADLYERVRDGIGRREEAEEVTGA